MWLYRPVWGDEFGCTGFDAMGRGAPAFQRVPARKQSRIGRLMLSHSGSTHPSSADAKRLNAKPRTARPPRGLPSRFPLMSHRHMHKLIRLRARRLRRRRPPHRLNRIHRPHRLRLHRPTASPRLLTPGWTCLPLRKTLGGCDQAQHWHPCQVLHRRAHTTRGGNCSERLRPGKYVSRRGRVCHLLV